MADLRIDNTNLNAAAAANKADAENITEAKKAVVEELKKEEALITSNAIENSKVDADVLATAESKAVSKAANVKDDDETPVVTDKMIEDLENNKDTAAPLNTAQETVQSKAPSLASTDASITAFGYAAIASVPQNSKEESVQEVNPSIAGTVQNSEINQLPNTNVNIPIVNNAELNKNISDNQNTNDQIPGNNLNAGNQTAFSTDALRYSAIANSASPQKPGNNNETDLQNTNADVNIVEKRNKAQETITNVANAVHNVANALSSGKKETKTETVEEQKEQTATVKAPEIKSSEKKDDPVNYIRNSHKEEERERLEGKSSDAKLDRKEKLRQEIDKEAKRLNKLFSSNKQTSKTGKSNKVNSTGKIKNSKSTSKKPVIQLLQDENGNWYAKRPETPEFFARDAYMMKAKSSYLQNNPEPKASEHYSDKSKNDENVENSSAKVNTDNTKKDFDEEQTKNNNTTGKKETFFAKYSKWETEYKKHMSALEKDYQASNKDYQEQYFAYRKAQLKAAELNDKSDSSYKTKNDSYGSKN